MNYDDDAEHDLLIEARRRLLSRDEETRLDELVRRSSEARILHYAGWSFDRDSSAREDDDVLVARLAARAVERNAKSLAAHPAPRRKRPLALLLAASLGIASVAAAGVGVYLVNAPEPVGVSPSPASSVSTRQRRASPLPVQSRRGTPAPDLGTAPVPNPDSVHTPPAVSTRPPRAASALPSDSPRIRAPADTPTARSLFARANDLRLSGDMRGAIAAYELLTERYPASSEADLAELSLGKLLLASGNANAALGRFRRAGSRGGALGSEALWGEASALRALGRTSEEKQALERLLALFPDGAYSKAARKRLGRDTR